MLCLTVFVVDGFVHLDFLWVSMKYVWTWQCWCDEKMCMSQLDDDDVVRLDLTCLSEPLSNPISALPDIHTAMSFIYVGITRRTTKKQDILKKNWYPQSYVFHLCRYYKKNNKKSRPLKNNLISTSSSLRITLQEQQKNQDLLNGSAHCHGWYPYHRNYTCDKR